jgi:DNA-binding Lrp family transcriptional regulator
MSKAIVLINTTVGSQSQVLTDLRKTLGVETAYSSQGIYDLVVEVQAKSLDELKTLVFHHIKQIRNIRATLTLTVDKE